MKFEHFDLGKIGEQRVVLLTNPLFHEIDALLVATLKPHTGRKLITGLQIPVVVGDEALFVDLLDMGSVSSSRIKSVAFTSLASYRREIKSGLDLLVDGF
ncbi:hypothetical protein [Bowmanella dokdonensis]|uniref:Toxin CcdB n=1 Tax=Bowmanella dokdonensis TaxID=751969 RepID=A0A939DP35_9ALTE|nr:hypothetical protein [Bowmanella dokdonensis]MBN7826160.1 hypothetical protein [Bowmanella dokdonensis]